MGTGIFGILSSTTGWIFPLRTVLGNLKWRTKHEMITEILKFKKITRCDHKEIKSLLYTSEFFQFNMFK